MGSPEWNVLMVDIHLRKLLWVYCPGHARVKGNDRADRLAGKATLTSGLLLGRSEVLRSLRHYMRAQIQGLHSVDRIEERGVERGSARRSSLSSELFSETWFQSTQRWICATSSASSSLVTGPSQNRLQNVNYLSQHFLWLSSCLFLWPFHCVHTFHAASFFCRLTDTSYPTS